VHFIEPILDELAPHGAELTLADHGAGKSYLGFILYDLWFKPHGSGTSTASRRAPSWSSARARWRSAWASSACAF
jgi:hypothetical protein